MVVVGLDLSTQVRNRFTLWATVTRKLNEAMLTLPLLPMHILIMADLTKVKLQLMTSFGLLVCPAEVIGVFCSAQFYQTHTHTQTVEGLRKLQIIIHPLLNSIPATMCIQYIPGCSSGHLDIVRYLVTEAQCDPNVGDKYGQTPLHQASR